LIANHAAKVKVPVRLEVVATVCLTTGEVLSAVIRDDPVSEPIFDEAVEDAVDGHPIHLLFQLCRDAVVAQSVGLLLQ
jgi:hypothetical protein